MDQFPEAQGALTPQISTSEGKTLVSGLCSHRYEHQPILKDRGAKRSYLSVNAVQSRVEYANFSQSRLLNFTYLAIATHLAH